MKKTCLMFFAVLALLCSLLNLSYSTNSIYALELCEEEKAALNLLDEVKEDYGFDNALEEFILSDVSDVAFGKIYRLVQMHCGNKVYGRGLNISANDKSEFLSVNGNYLKLNCVRPALISEQEAIEIIDQSFGVVSVTKIEKVVYTFEKYETDPVFAYDINVITEQGGERIMISAYNGEIIFVTDQTSGVAVKTTQTDFFNNEVEVWVEKQSNTSYLLSDFTRNIITYDMSSRMGGNVGPMESKTGIFDDGMAVSIFNNLVKAYDFYADKNNLGVSILGIDGRNDEVWGNFQTRREVEIDVFIHYGNKYENAYYAYESDTSSVIVIGDGNPDGVIYNPGAAIDIIAHEYQHGVTTYKVGLDMRNEAGALSEAISDIFGALIEGYDPSDDRFWVIGEEGVPSKYQFLRSMISPSETIDGGKINYINKYPDCNEQHNHDMAMCDYGGVHFNSTILTHMQYNIYKQMPEYFTRQNIGKLWYSTLCLLTPNATFKEFGNAFLTSARNLQFSQEAIEVIEENLFRSGITATEGDFHMVHFLNHDGTLIEEICVKDGDSAVIFFEPQFKRNNSQLEFIFEGWDGEFDNITQDTIIRAQFIEKLKEYTVTFVGYNDEVLKEEKVQYGNAATPPTEVATVSDAEYDYDFIGWDQEFDEISKDTIVTARFERIRCYTVTFMNDGIIVDTQRVREGEAAVAPSDPVKESTETLNYRFKGWSDSYDNITSDLTVYAQFDGYNRQYSVRFMSDGTEYYVDNLEFGVKIVLPEDPTRDGYTFVGWFYDEACLEEVKTDDTVSGDIVIYAKWEQVQKKSSCGMIDLSSMIPPLFILFAATLLIVVIPKRRMQNR